MDNPSLILLAVDRRLDHEVRLVLYGRSAVCLGFDNSPPEVARTQDVDAIISYTQSHELGRDPTLRWLRLFRPATVDLILTKMMRGNDPQDMADAGFMIRHDHVTPEQLEAGFAAAVIPDLVEYRDAFARAKPVVLKLARDN
jgi:hypothetical protein